MVVKTPRKPFYELCSRNAFCRLSLRMAGTVDGTKAGPTGYPWWALRFWHGMTLGVWLALLRRHGFRISPSRLWLVVLVTLFSLFNSLLAACTQWYCWFRLRKARPHPQPVILVGHHRSGTTLLHELMVTDARWGYPDTYQCFAPSHALLTRRHLIGWLEWLLPRQRPEDGMKVGLRLPQEDEFALMNLGAPSPYEEMGFPLDPESPWQALDLDKGDPALRKLWQDTFEKFLRSLAAADSRPPVIKSPLHMARIGLILERIPGARFVHIRRNPYQVIPSWISMSRGLQESQGLGRMGDKGLERHLQNYHEVFELFERHLPKLGPGRFHELTYEDLVADPKRELGRLYAALGIEGFDPETPALRRRLEEMREFKPVQRRIPAPADLDRMEAAFGDRARKWGYQRPVDAGP